jgi:hypothetical protein
MFMPDPAGFDRDGGTFGPQALLMQAGRHGLTCLFAFSALDRISG